MGVVVKLRHARASAGSRGKKSSSGNPVARLSLAAREKDGARQPVSMRDTVATVVPAASATSLSDSSLASRWARSGCIENFLPRWKKARQAKLSTADKDAWNPSDYDVPMVERIGPRKPRQRPYLREHRKARGWSLDELAARLDTTAATISRYETGKRDYPGGFQAAAAEVFGISEADLYRLPDQPSLDAMVENEPPAVREAARAMIKALLESKVMLNKRGKTGT